MVSKETVNYRPADGWRSCMTCIMYHHGRCDLVTGRIYPEDVCDRWERK